MLTLLKPLDADRLKQTKRRLSRAMSVTRLGSNLVSRLPPPKAHATGAASRDFNTLLASPEQALAARREQTAPAADAAAAAPGSRARAVA